MVTESSNPIHATEIIVSQGTKTDNYNDNYKESMDFKFKHTTCKEIVKQILRQDKKARKDYSWLLLLVWIKQGAIKFIIPLEDYKKMYKPESVSRVCRELVESAKKGNKELKWLLNDEETLEKRENLQELNRGYFQDKKSGELAKIVK